MILALKTIFEPLRRLKVGDFIHNRELPPDAVASLERLVDMFTEGGEDVRREVNVEIDPSISFVFFMYAGQLAEQSVRDQNPRLVNRGLVALAIENDTFDWRDSRAVLAQLYHSARHFPQINADDVFRDAAEASRSPFRETLRAFVDGSDAAKSIETFGLKESGSRDSFRYDAVQRITKRPSTIGKFLRRVRRVIPIPR